MLIGLVFVAVGGRRRTVINNVVQVSTAPGAAPMQANISDGLFRRRKGIRREPDIYLSEEPHADDRPLIAPPLVDVTPRHESQFNRSGFPYDRVKWDALVQYDPDISRVAAALQAYDSKYTDEFAAAYLALNDKSYLSMIIQKILASAKQDEAQRRRA